MESEGSDHAPVSSVAKTGKDADCSSEGAQVVKLLAEIVGGFKLGEEEDGRRAVESNGASDNDVKLYCVVRMGDTVIHKTKGGEGGRNPVWTVSTKSTFLIEATPEELAHGRLDISVWSKQKDPFNLTVIATRCWGMISLALSDVVLSHCDEQRVEVDITKKDGSPSHGTLTLRFRLATASDERFLGLLNKRPELLKKHSELHLEASSPDRPTSGDSKKMSAVLVTEADETQMAGETFMNAISGAFKSRRYYDKKAGKHKVLVKPGPDPARKEETAYLTKEQLLAETNAPSHQWIEAGSGQLGKLYLEVLSCHDLPNVDVGEAVGNVTDAFVCAVFEDVMVQTPVIDDELSPCWLPWTQRAYIFGICHPSSTLYLAPFDYDFGVTNHEALGRAVVNIANLQRDTDYVLQYKLYPSTNVTDRTAVGSIKIRLRIEYNNEKEVLLAALRPRPKFHINVRKEKSLFVLRYTCFGEYGDDNEQAFDLTVLRSYVNEILSYKKAIAYSFGDAIRSLIFWRGQVHVCKDLDIPLHSFLFFCFATTLVEKPYLAPPFFLLSIAWLMLATQTLRRQHPSPWNRCHSLWHYIDVLWRGESSPAFHSIRVDEGAREEEEYEQAWQNRLEKDEQFAATQAALQEKIDKMGSEAIHTKFTGGIPLDLIARLTRYQGILGRLCMKFRMIKIVVTWEESYLSFWITACFLAGGFVSLILPWPFICLWSARIIVWGLFGPHMKLLDLHFQAQGKEEDVIEKAVENFKNQSHFAIRRRHEAVKLRDMKELAFGPYSSLVPSFNLSRHNDRPLAASSALYQNPKKACINIAPVRVPGQQFFGTILPRTEHEESEYKNEIANLEERKHHVQSTVQAIKEMDHGGVVKDDSMPDEVGYELISEIGGKGSADDKEFRVSDTTSVSLSPASNVAIVRSDMKSSSAKRRSSTFRGGIELVRFDENDDDIAIGDAQAVSPKSGLAICEVNKDLDQVQTTSIKNLERHSVLPSTLPKNVQSDEERETGEVEVVLGDPTLRDDFSFQEDSSEGSDRISPTGNMTGDDWDETSRILYFTASTMS